MDRAVAPRPFTRGPGSTHRVSFTGRLTNAVLASTAAPLPPFRRPPAPAPRGPVAAPPTDADPTTDVLADRARIAAVLDQLGAAAADLRARQAGDLDQLRQAAVTLAINVTARVFHHEVSAGQFPLEQIAHELVAQLVDEEPIRVRLHPDDLALLSDRLDGQPLLPTDEPKLVADPTLTRGAVAVDGPTQSLRADPVRTLDEIRDELLRSIAHARS